MSKTNQFTFQEIMHSVAIVFVWLPKDFIKSLIIFIFPKLYARRFNADIIIEAYAQKLKKNKIEPYFVDLLRTIKLEYGDNFYLRDGLPTHYVWKKYFANSKSVEQIKWLRHTCFMTNFGNAELDSFYNDPKRMHYSQVEKLAAIDNNIYRLKQFEYVDEKYCKNQSYLEIGGILGALALIAASMGFKKSINYELSDVLRNEGIRIANSQQINNFYGLSEFPENEMFDFVSCHQVLEHLQDPTGLLVSIRNCLNDEGLLFLSVGYHAFPHPGHFRLKYNLNDLFKKNGLINIADPKQDGGLIVLRKRKHDEE